MKTEYREFEGPAIAMSIFSKIFGKYAILRIEESCDCDGTRGQEGASDENCGPKKIENVSRALKKCFSARSVADKLANTKYKGVSLFLVCKVHAWDFKLLH